MNVRSGRCFVGLCDATLRLFFAACLVAVSAAAASAQALYWDNNGSTAGFGTAAGTWAAPTIGDSTQGWSTSNNGTLVPGNVTTSTSNTTNFGNGATGLGAGTITVSGTVDSGSMTFASGSGAIVLSGGIINFAASPTVTVNNTTNTIASNLTGSTGTFIKDGTGTLILSGTNSAAGISVNRGTLAITGTQTSTGTITLNAGTLNLGNGGATGTISTRPLILAGGALNFSRTGNVTQSFTSTAFNTPNNANSLGSPSISVATGNMLNLGTLTRQAGVTFDFSTLGGGSASTSTGNTNGILAGFTFGDSWAVANGAGVAISSLGTYTQTSVAGTTSSNYTNNNIDTDSSPGVLDAVITPNSLRFSAAAANTLTLAAGNNTIGANGILVGSGVGNNLSTITGGSLTGAASAELIVFQNNTAGGLTIASSIVNNTATSLTKQGAGLLTLSGNNTFTGGLVIGGGTVTLANAGALNSTAGSENAVTFGGGSTGRLQLGGNGVVLRSLATNAQVPGTPIVENASASPATLTLGNSANASSTYVGTVQDGTGGGALSIVKVGTGNIAITGTNTFTGGVTVNAGTLQVTTLSSSGGVVTLDGGQLRIPSANLSVARAVTVGSGGGSIFVNKNNAFTTTGNLTGSTTLTLLDGGGSGTPSTYNFNSTSNSFTGALVLNNSFMGFNSLPDSSGNITFNAAATNTGGGLTYGSNATAPLAFGLSGRGLELNSAATVTFTVQNNNTTHAISMAKDLVATGAGAKTLGLGAVAGPTNVFSGNITNGTGGGTVALIKSGAGTWRLSGTNTYTGGTSVTGGTLILSGNNVSLTTGSLAMSNGTTLQLEANGSNTSSGISTALGYTGGSATGNANPGVGITTTATFLLRSDSSVTFNGTSGISGISGATLNIDVANNGAGTGNTITFSPNGNVYGGGVTVNVTGANGYNLALGNWNSNNTGGTLTFNPTSANVTVGNLAANTGTPTRTVALSGTASNNTIGAITSTNYSLTKSSTSTWVLAGNSTYTGLTTVSGGVLRLANVNSIPGGIGATGGASAITLNGGTLSLAFNDFQRAIGTGVDQINISGGTSGFSAFGADRVVNLGGASGSVTWGSVSFNATTFVLNTSSATGNLTFQNPVDLGASTRTVSTDANVATMSGAVSGTGGFTKNGAGTLRLSNTNSYSGVTTVSAGTFEASVVANGGANSSIGSSSNAAANLSLANGTTFRYVGSGSVTSNRAFTISGTVAGHGATIESSGSGTLSFDTPATAIAYGSNNQARTLTLGGTNTGLNTFGKIIANNGAGATSLVKSGTGRWVLNQANTYTGGTSVSGGTLVVNNTTGSGTGTGTVSIGALATLGGNGTISGATTIDGSHAPGNSPGIQTFGGGLTYNGTSTLTWELIDNTVAGRGTNYDGVNVTGGAFALVTGAEIDLAFGGTVDFLDTFWSANQTWLVVDLSGGATASDTNLFTIGSITGGANYNPGLGTFSTSRASGSNAADAVYLNWVAVPEPATMALAACGLIGLGFAARRRFGRKA